jgi:molybdate transport system substrate-binding protein
MHFRIWLAAILFATMVTACAAPVAPSNPAGTPAGELPGGDLTVFAAASLTEAFTELGAQFEVGHPSVDLVFNFAGSQQLVQQLAQGAGADVFASANQAQLDAAIEAGRVEGGSARTFARNQLVVIYPLDNPGVIASLDDLAKPGLRLVIAAKEVPVGRYALAFLDKAAQDPGFGPAYQAGVLDNVVSYEENVRAVLTKVVLGEADAGIVYTSDISGENGEKVNRMDIPTVLNVIAEYPIAVVQDSAHPDAALAFVDFVLSADGQSILEKYGFLPVED